MTLFCIKCVLVGNNGEVNCDAFLHHNRLGGKYGEVNCDALLHHNRFGSNVARQKSTIKSVLILKEWLKRASQNLSFVATKSVII